MPTTRNYLRLTFILTFLIISFQAYSVNPHKELIADETKVVVKKTKKTGAIKKWVIKRITQKLQKKIKAAQDKDPEISNKARTGLIFGIISFILLFSGIAAPILFLFAAIGAILGDIFSIVALSKTKDETELYKKERRQAIWGLVLSLLTGVLPLSLLILLVIG